MSAKRSNANKVGYTSEVLRGAERGEDHARRILELDRELIEQGFVVPPDIVGKNGIELEEAWLVPYSKKVQRVDGADVPHIPDDQQAVRNALQKNLLLGLYDQWKLHAKPWLHDLHGCICEELAHHFKARDITVTPGMLSRLVKPVVCLQTEMDLHRGTDMLFVFHDPATYASASQAFAPGSRQDACYWNPDADTIVTVDVTASLTTKRDRAERRDRMPRADVFASKVGAEANDGLKSYLHGAGHQTLVKDPGERLRQLAKLIVALYVAKQQHQLPALRNPEHEQEVRAAQLATERREHFLATLEGRGRRRQKEQAKETERREQSQIARERRDARKKINEALDPRRKKGGDGKKKK